MARQNTKTTHIFPTEGTIKNVTKLSIKPPPPKKNIYIYTKKSINLEINIYRNSIIPKRRHEQPKPF